ncbi:MAG: sensor histidine kinase, partial [Sedimenticolaceae bacterium]
LVRNAQQASPVGSPVRIRCRPSGAGWVEVEIANQGPVIPQKMLERVFEPFYTSKNRGTGLGLPIVQRIVDAHGGEIELVSDEENGTRAILRLPTAAGAMDAEKNQAAEADDNA